MTHDEMIAVIQANKDGKTIQCRYSNRLRHNDEWSTAAPSWNFEQFEYRVKPEPREWWGAIQEGEPYPSLWPCLSDAKECVLRLGGKLIKVREVLE